MTTAGETLPLLRDTATRVRDDRAAPIRSQGEASSSGRGSKKPYRLLASIGAASLGLMLVAGTALGRGGLDGHLHLTSLGEAARGKARVSRHKGHGATVGAGSHHALQLRPLWDVPSKRGAHVRHAPACSGGETSPI